MLKHTLQPLTARLADIRIVNAELSVMLASPRKLLTEKGFRVKILDVKIPTRKREAWVDKQVENGIDVLIVNPSLVETGLDLNAFTTLIFFNLAFSLYVFRQASRRSWRINQTAPKVEVYMFYYSATLITA